MPDRDSERRRFADAEAELATAYAHGRRVGRSGLAAEQVDPAIVSEGDSLREAALSCWRGRYAGRTERVFLCTWAGPSRSYFFADLMACLEYSGVKCGWSTYYDPGFELRLGVFAPTTVIALEDPDYVASPAFAAVLTYRNEHPCRVLHVPCAPRRTADEALSETQKTMLESVRASGIDAYFSLLNASWVRTIGPEWFVTGTPLIEFPFAFSPLVHHPVDAIRDLDFFMVCGREHDRIEVAHTYLLPIFREYFGVWAGGRWRFGEGDIPPAQTPHWYARARAAINPLHRTIVANPVDISQRTFAALACGAFVLTDRTPITHHFFAPDELTCVDSPEQFREAFAWYVAHRDERELVAIRGMRRVFAQHTYFHRIDALLAALDRLPPRSA